MKFVLNIIYALVFTIGCHTATEPSVLSIL